MRTSDKDGKTLAALVMSAWKEYQDNGYPKDPRCYVVRASPEAAAEMRQLQLGYKFTDTGQQPLPEGKSFLKFRLEEDRRLSPDEVHFGPETIRIEWSRK